MATRSPRAQTAMVARAPQPARLDQAESEDSFGGPTAGDAVTLEAARAPGLGNSVRRRWWALPLRRKVRANPQYAEVNASKTQNARARRNLAGHGAQSESQSRIPPYSGGVRARSVWGSTAKFRTPLDRNGYKIIALARARALCEMLLLLRVLLPCGPGLDLAFSPCLDLAPGLVFAPERLIHIATVLPLRLPVLPG